jgi:hypothetical protein
MLVSISKGNSSYVPRFLPLISGDQSKCDICIVVSNAQTVLRRTNQRRVSLYAMLHTKQVLFLFISIPTVFLHTAIFIFTAFIFCGRLHILRCPFTRIKVVGNLKIPNCSEYARISEGSSFTVRPTRLEIPAVAASSAPTLVFAQSLTSTHERNVDSWTP